MSEPSHYTVLREMLEARGFTVKVDHDTYDGLADYALNGFRENEEIVALCLHSDKLDISTMKHCVQTLISNGIEHGIIVYRSSITPMAKRVATTCEDIRLELRQVSELQFNITKHVLQPQYYRLLPDEALRFRRKYGAGFPVMKRTDKIAEFYDYRTGDVIRITRHNGYPMYRIVC